MHALSAQADDPWQSSANRAFLRSFYEKLCLWLATPANKTYHISDVYIWVGALLPRVTAAAPAHQIELLARMYMGGHPMWACDLQAD